MLGDIASNVGRLSVCEEIFVNGTGILDFASEIELVAQRCRSYTGSRVVAGGR